MTSVRVHLNIGSNLGDRHALISMAVAKIASVPGVKLLGVSTPVESEPWGFESDNRFINVGVAVEVSVQMNPLTLLDHLQAIEREIGGTPHRNPDGTYRDRRLDIDIITFGTLHVATERLTLPHPRMSARPFVTGPMQELEEALGSRC